MSRKTSDVPVFWTLSAERDLDRIDQFYRALDPKASREIISRILKSVDSLVRYPKLGKLSDLGLDREYRELIVSHFRVFYRLETDRRIVARIWDTRQNPEDFFSGE